MDSYIDSLKTNGLVALRSYDVHSKAPNAAVASHRQLRLQELMSELSHRMPPGSCRRLTSPAMDI